MIHHIAIGTKNPDGLKQFYSVLPGLVFEKDHFLSSGELRSSWFFAGETRIMIEKEENPKAPLALVFSVPDRQQRRILEETFASQFEGKTEFTRYFKDPDGNRLGFSSYPEPWVS